MTRWTTGWKRGRGAALPAVSIFAAGCLGGPEYAQTTFEPVTEFGASLNRVFYNTFAWTMAIMVLVLVLMVVVLVRYRERPGRPHPKQIHGNTRLEIIWTLVPAVIVTFIAVPTVQTVFSSQRPPDPGALQIEVIGHQWWWEFRYPEQGVITANEFIVPVGRQVHLRLTSADVIHSFWVPRMGGKRDVMPQPRTAEGENPRPNHLVFTVDSAGQYRGQCAEFCGEAHGLMAMYGHAVEPAAFDTWVDAMRTGDPAPAAPPAGGAAADTAADQTALPPQQTLEQQGREIFLSRACIACHAISGTTAQGRVGPDLTRFGARETVGAGAAPNTAANVEQWIRDPQTLKAGALMPGAQAEAGGFPPTGLSDEEVRAVAAYLGSLR
jgi:cytochrome c oxidase subunit 2